MVLNGGIRPSLDPHIEESDDPHSRFTGVLTSEVENRLPKTQMTVAHLTVMYSDHNVFADKLWGLLARNDISVVTNPTTNAELQLRRDNYSRHWGHTRTDELLNTGVTAGIGQGRMIDNYHSYGGSELLCEFYHIFTLDEMAGYPDPVGYNSES